MRPRRALVLAAAPLLLLGACGNGEETAAEAPTPALEEDPDPTPAVDEDPDRDAVGHMDEFNQLTADYDGPVNLDLDRDELTELARELFDGHLQLTSAGSHGVGSSVSAVVDPEGLSEEQLLAGCDALVDFVVDQPAGAVAGPVLVAISDDEHILAAKIMVIGEDEVERGSCEP